MYDSSQYYCHCLPSQQLSVGGGVYLAGSRLCLFLAGRYWRDLLSFGGNLHHYLPTLPTPYTPRPSARTIAEAADQSTSRGLHRHNFITAVWASRSYVYTPCIKNGQRNRRRSCCHSGSTSFGGPPSLHCRREP